MDRDNAIRIARQYKMVGDWFANVPLLWTASRKINVLIEPVLIDECHPSPLYEDIMKTGIQI